MSYFKHPVLVSFVSSPGSGKSFFSRQAAERMNAIHLSSDAMRIAIFGSKEGYLQAYAQTSHERVLEQIYGAMGYSTEKALGAGNDVFYDTNSVKREHRLLHKGWATKYGAVPIVVRLLVPDEVAFNRGLEREESPDSRRKTEDEMRELMQRIASLTDEPGDDENVVKLDGQISFDEQFADFEHRVKEIIRKSAAL